MTQHADAGAAGTPRPPLSRLAEPGVLAGPHPGLAPRRGGPPLAESGGALVVLGRHADCSRILRDPRASSERNRSLLGPPGTPRAQSFLSMDPPDHTRLRRLVSPALTPPA